MSPQGGKGFAQGAAAALLGTAVSLVAAAAVSTLIKGFSFPVLVVAERVASLAPGKVAAIFIDTLQHKALPLTVLATAAGLFAVVALLGTASVPLTRRSSAWAAAALTALPIWAVGVIALAPSPVTVSRLSYALLLAACAVPGVFVTGRTLERNQAWRADPSTGAEPMTRRTFLRATWLGAVGVALGWARLGRVLFPSPDPGRTPLALRDVTTVTPPPASAGDAGFSGISGLAPLITANSNFYTVNEEIIDPDVDPRTWTLSMGGLVDHPYELTYDQLLALPAVEQYTTLECISNPVGGDLISNAKWTGVLLKDLLDRAGVQPSAVEVVSRSISGYSDSIPVADAMRSDTLVVIGMNGMTLPRAHGFPARLLVPGHYGMKQPKWLVSIDPVDKPYQGYWETRGWVKAAIVKTMSRVDTTAQAAGVQTDAGWEVAGVAFAGDRGVQMVEVSTDGGTTWAQAELETALSALTWRRWRFPFDKSKATSLVVRATDGDGLVQISTPADPHPSGASGYQQASP
jgi:DMSO/TMAO reductase YedYZ molybdopterin-dependent catalytic subunit